MGPNESCRSYRTYRTYRIYRTLEDQYTLYNAVQKVQGDHHFRILCQTAGVQTNGISMSPSHFYSVGSVQ